MNRYTVVLTSKQTVFVLADTDQHAERIARLPVGQGLDDHGIVVHRADPMVESVTVHLNPRRD